MEIPDKIRAFNGSHRRNGRERHTKMTLPTKRSLKKKCFKDNKPNIPNKEDKIL